MNVVQGYGCTSSFNCVFAVRAHSTSILPCLQRASVFFFQVSSLLNFKSNFLSIWLFQMQVFGHCSECLICPTSLMPASPQSSRPKGPSLRCVSTWSAKLQTDATLYWSPGPSSFPTLKWESLHLAHSNVIRVWFWWDPNAEAGSVILAPSELHILFLLFLPSKLDLRHSFGHLSCSSWLVMLPMCLLELKGSTRSHLTKCWPKQEVNI